MTIHILGAGIAGLSLAEALDRRAVPWQLYEKAAVPGNEASGKNAGIVRTYESDPVVRHFTSASLAYYRRAEKSFKATGLLLRPWEVDYTETVGIRREFSHGRFDGIFLPENGTIEPDELLARLAGQKFQHGNITFGFEAEVEHQGGQIHALLQTSGNARTSLGAGDFLVVACGEGSLHLADTIGRSLQLIAHRRTLFEFRNIFGYDGPVEWDEESGVYFRRQKDGSLLATAGEQIPTRAESTVLPDEDAKLIAVMAKEFPFLSQENLLGRRTCRRLTALDNRPCIGRDPQFLNLFWFTGLGGRGISMAPALAETLSGLLCGETAGAEFIEKFSPARTGH